MSVSAKKITKQVEHAIEHWPSTNTATHERAIIGSLVAFEISAEVASDLVLPEEFEDVYLGRMFLLVQRLRFEGLREGDDVRLITELVNAGLPDDYAGPAALGKFINEACSPQSLPYHAAKVAAGAAVRRVLKLISEAIDKTRDLDVVPADLCEWLAEAAAKLCRRESRGGGVTTFSEVGTELISQLRSQLTGTPQRAIFTGLPVLDDRIGGMAPGELVLLAARPAMGKTTLAMQMAAHNAQNDRDVLYLSLEMSGKELVQRMLCGYCEISSVRIRSGHYSESDVNNMEAALENYNAAPFHIYAPPRATVEHFAAAARSVAARKPLSLIVVDYLTLLSSAQRKNRYQEIGDIAKGLRQLGKELNAPVLALCQLNRDADDGAPKLRHLRESGDLEQDADIVMFIHKEKDDTQLIVAKHRNGPPGVIRVLWYPKSSRFADVDEGSEFK